MTKDNLNNAITRIKGYLKNQIVSYMKQANITVTGSTANSVKVLLIKRRNVSGLEVTGNMAFITRSKGRRPNKRRPPSDAIKGWIRNKPLSVAGVDRTSYLIAKSIGEKGYQGANITENAIVPILPRILNDIRKGYKKDLELHIKKGLKNVN